MSRRLVTAALLGVACAAGGVLTAAPAQALPVEAATFTAVSDAGDPVGGGGTYSYSVASGDQFSPGTDSSTTGGLPGRVNVLVFPTDGSYWAVNFVAPAGQSLVPGTYDNVVQAPTVGSAPGLRVDHDFSRCATITGSFTITEAAYGRDGYVETLHATFEQHCDGAAPALRGEVRVDNPPQPPPLALTSVIRNNGTVSTVTGRATVKGTLTCTQAVPVSVSGIVTQVVRRVRVVTSFGLQVQCTPGAPVPWKAVVSPDGGIAYKPGDAEVYTEAYATDVVSGAVVRIEKTRIVTLVAA
jgi:hypothetical protein